VRLHGATGLYASGYGAPGLGTWARRVRRWAAAEGGARGVFVYFDNDAKIRAPADALALAERLGQTPQAGGFMPAAAEFTP
jgi:uncharacterized protein YecE (DUF72 family)